MIRAICAFAALCSTTQAFAVDFAVRGTGFGYLVRETETELKLSIGKKAWSIPKKKCAASEIEAFIKEFAAKAESTRIPAALIDGPHLVLFSAGKREMIGKHTVFGKWLDRAPFNFIVRMKMAEEACEKHSG